MVVHIPSSFFCRVRKRTGKKGSGQVRTEEEWFVKETSPRDSGTKYIQYNEVSVKDNLIRSE